MSRGADRETLLIPCQINEKSPGFLEALVLARDFKCTEPRDHLFALWNIAQDKDRLDFRPDYSKPCEVVYAEFTQAWIAQHGTLDMLGTVEATEQSHPFYEVAPSWCPNWSFPATTGCLVRKDYIPNLPMFMLEDQDGKLYSADGGMTHDTFDNPIFFFENGVLHCQGIILEQIKFILEDAPAIPFGTSFPRCDPGSNWRFRVWTEQIKEYYHKHELTTYDDPLRAAWAMCHGDTNAAWPPPEESGYDPACYDSNQPYVCLPSLSRHVYQWGSSYSHVAAWSVVKSVLRGRRPFISATGYMGLAPGYIAEHDSEAILGYGLAVVAGCSTPLLLREKGDGTYQLLGSCFVQGWMDGEWMETMMGSESPNDFWEALKDDAKLMIS